MLAYYRFVGQEDGGSDDPFHGLPPIRIEAAPRAGEFFDIVQGSKHYVHVVRSVVWSRPSWSVTYVPILLLSPETV